MLEIISRDPDRDIIASAGKLAQLGFMPAPANLVPASPAT
jgi:hypothetical protein